MDPSPGNIAPSWPVAIAHGIRNTTNPMIHQPNADGPADCTTAALVMNKTIATKIATMSNVVSTLGRMPPATRSEMSEPESVPAAVMASPQLGESPEDLPTWDIPGTPVRKPQPGPQLPFPADRVLWPDRRQACWYPGETAGGLRHGDRARRHRGGSDSHRHHRQPPTGLSLPRAVI